MGFADIWNRTLVYFGIAEEDDWDEDGYVTEEELERTYSERPNVRRLAPRRRQEQFDDWTDPGDEAPTQLRPRLRGIDTASVQVHLNGGSVDPTQPRAELGRCLVPGIGPVVELLLAPPGREPADVGALRVGALELLLGHVAVLVPVVLLGDPEVDE